jgi:hypothetical protein
VSSLFGVIEGFYGRQWSWSQRQSLLRLLPDFGCNVYLYAPKGDPFLRKRWRDDWPSEVFAEIEALSSLSQSLSLSFGVGLSVLDYSEADQAALEWKIERLNQLELGHLGVFFDDMRGDDDGLLDRQLSALRLIRERSHVSTLIFCPTYYSLDPVLEKVFGQRPADYWSRLANELPTDVQCFWTGPEVCSQRFNAGDAQLAEAILGRKPAIWDNYPVNDGRLTSQYLHVQPAMARALPAGTYQSFFINPMNQFELSLPVLAAARKAIAGDEVGARQACETFARQRWGEDFANVWHRYADVVQREGLLAMSPEVRDEMLSVLQNYDLDAAREWCDWLRGGYEFDPACLTE